MDQDLGPKYSTEYLHLIDRGGWCGPCEIDSSKDVASFASKDSTVGSALLRTFIAPSATFDRQPCELIGPGQAAQPATDAPTLMSSLSRGTYPTSGRGNAGRRTKCC